MIRKKESWACLMGFWLGFCLSAPGALPPDVLAQNARGATMLVRNLEGRKSIGTGFFIYPDLLVTNKHVLESLEVELVDEQGRTQRGRCVAEAKEDDLALVRAMTPSGYLNLRPSEPKYGEKVFIMGNPRGLQYTLSDGIVSHPVKPYPAGMLFQHTAPTSPGSSGSAVLDADGRVIGVVCSQITDSQNLNFAIPVSRLKDLIQKWRLGLARPAPKKPAQPEETKPSRAGGGIGPGGGLGPGAGGGGGGGMGPGSGSGGSGGSCPPSDPKDELQDLLAKARALFKKGELDSASEIYQQIIRIRPDLAEAYVGLGAVRAKQDRPAEALEAYDQASRLAPQDGRVDLERGKFFYRSNQSDKALDDFRSAIRKDPGREEAWEAAAEILRKQGKSQEASELMREGLQRNPGWGESEKPSEDGKL